MNLTANIKVSIRLMSGGHSFSPEALNSAVERCGEKLTVELVTPKTTLVPASVFRAEDAPSYLAALGLAADVNESVVCSPQIGDVVAVMAISAECLAYLSLLCGDKMLFVTPLLLGYAPKEGAVVELHGEVLYVRIFNGGMLFSEAMDASSDVDIVYYLQQIHQVYNLYTMRVRARGDVERIKMLCKGLFTQLECE